MSFFDAQLPLIFVEPRIFCDKPLPSKLLGGKSFLMKGCLQFFGGPSKCFWRNSGLQILFWFLYVKYVHTDYTHIKRSWKCTCVSKQSIGGANCCTCTPARCIVTKYDCTCAAGRSNVAPVSRSIMISIVALAKSEKKIDFPCYVWRPLIKAFLRYFFVHLLRSQLLFFAPEITAVRRNSCDL